MIDMGVVEDVICLCSFVHSFISSHAYLMISFELTSLGSTPVGMTAADSSASQKSGQADRKRIREDERRAVERPSADGAT